MASKAQLKRCCAHCGRSISDLAYKMVISNKPYLMCKCKLGLISDFMVADNG